MRTYELEPTYNNLFSTYFEDSILRNRDLSYFIDILNTRNDSCSIALNGAWGSGKTFFVKQAKMILDAHNDSIESGCEAFRDRDRIKERWNRDSGQRIANLQPQVCVLGDANKPQFGPTAGFASYTDAIFAKQAANSAAGGYKYFLVQ